MQLQNLPTVIMKNDHYLNVETSNPTDFILKILDTDGRFVKTITQKLERGVYEFKINLNSVSKGLYVLNAFSGDRFIRAIRFTLL